MKLPSFTLSFDWNRFLSREERIGGLAITETSIALTYLHPRTYATLFQKELPLADGVIRNGILMREEALAAALYALKNQHPPSHSVILSLPPAAAQPFLYEFFPHLHDREIKNALSLIVRTSLPLPADQTYADWEEVDDSHKQKKRFILAMGVRALIEPYVRALEHAGFTPVAAETHEWSFARTFKLDSNASLFISFRKEELVFSVYQASAIVFQYNAALPEGVKNTSDAFMREVAYLTWRVMQFLSSDPKYQFKISRIFLLTADRELDRFEDVFRRIVGDFEFLTSTSRSNAIPFSVGAARRGVIPRVADRISSIMAIGTEMAYAREHLFAFADFFQKFILSLGAFFILVFGGTYMVVDSVIRATERSLVQVQAGVPAQIEEIKGVASDFNQRIALLSGIIDTTPYWEYVFLEIDELLNPGLTITGIKLSLESPIVVNGVAASRENLLQLRSTLEKSTVFNFENLPLSALVDRENISFSLNLTLKEPDILYQR